MAERWGDGEGAGRRWRLGGGGEESAARATSLLFQRHIVRETKPGRAGAHTRTHSRRPGRLLSPGAAKKAVQLFFPGARSSASSERSTEPALQARKAGGPAFFLRCLRRPRRPIPRPELPSLPPHPSGFHADSAPSPVWNRRFSTSDSARAPRPVWVDYGERSAGRKAAFREVLARNLQSGGHPTSREYHCC